MRLALEGWVGLEGWGRALAAMSWLGGLMPPIQLSDTSRVQRDRDDAELLRRGLQHLEPRVGHGQPRPGAKDRQRSQTLIGQHLVHGQAVTAAHERVERLEVR